MDSRGVNRGRRFFLQAARFSPERNYLLPALSYPVRIFVQNSPPALFQLEFRACPSSKELSFTVRKSPLVFQPRRLSRSIDLRRSKSTYRRCRARRQGTEKEGL
jgi:hypothetical protein